MGKRKVSKKIWVGWFKKSSVELVKRLLNEGELNLVPVLTPVSLPSTQLTHGSTHTDPIHRNSASHIHTHTHIPTKAHSQTQMCTYTLTDPHANTHTHIQTYIISWVQSLSKLFVFHFCLALYKVSSISVMKTYLVLGGGIIPSHQTSQCA